MQIPTREISDNNNRLKSPWTNPRAIQKSSHNQKKLHHPPALFGKILLPDQERKLFACLYPLQKHIFMPRSACGEPQFIWPKKNLSHIEKSINPKENNFSYAQPTNLGNNSLVGSHAHPVHTIVTDDDKAICCQKIQENDTQWLEEKLQSGEYTETSRFGIDQDTLLHLAVTNKQLTIVKPLINDKVFSSEEPNKIGETPTCRAADLFTQDQQDDSILKYLLETKTANGNNTCFIESEEETVVQILLKSEKTAIIEYLLEKKLLDIEKKSSDGSTALSYACWLGNIAVVKLLIRYGASVDTWDTNKESPLCIALHNQNLELIDIILEKHPRIISGNDPVLSTVLSLIDSYDNIDYSKWIPIGQKTLEKTPHVVPPNPRSNPLALLYGDNTDFLEETKKPTEFYDHICPIPSIVEKICEALPLQQNFLHDLLSKTITKKLPQYLIEKIVSKIEDIRQVYVEGIPIILYVLEKDLEFKNLLLRLPHKNPLPEHILQGLQEKIFELQQKPDSALSLVFSLVNYINSPKNPANPAVTSTIPETTYNLGESTSLIESIRDNDYDRFSLLVKEQPNLVNQYTKTGHTPLMEACKQQNYRMVTTPVGQWCKSRLFG